MKTVSDLFLTTIRGSHSMIARADILNRGALVAEDLPIVGGKVTLDSGAGIRGRCDLQIAGSDWVPLVPSDPLAPYGNEIRVKRGVRYPNGDEELISLGIFRIDETPIEDPGGRIKVVGYDRSITVRDARLEAPYIVTAGTEWTAAITTLVDGSGWWTSGYPLRKVTAASTSVAPLTVAAEQEDRWKLVTAWATAIGYEAWFDGDGALRLLPVPKYDRLSPVFTIDDGSTGVMITAGRKWKRTGIFNRVIAIGETATGVYRGVATDDNPASPTYYYGSFGRVPRWYASPLITSAAQAKTAAEAILRRSLGQSSEVKFTSLTNPALEPGDLITVRRTSLGIDTDFIVDSVEIPLDAAVAQTMKVRERVL